MPVTRLNNANIEKIKHPEKGYTLYWDDGGSKQGQKGLGLRVTAASKTYIVQSVVKGRYRRVTIGSWPSLTPEEAIKRARTILNKMSEGIDPNKEKAAERAKDRTLQDVFNDYMDRKQLRAKTQEVYHKAFRAGLADWSKKKLEDITRDDVENRYDRMRKGYRCVGNKFTKVQNRQRGDRSALASQAMRLLGQMYNFENAVYDRDIRNPVKRLSYTRKGWSVANHRQTILQDSELPVFYNVVMSTRSELTRDCLMLLALTGLRLQEGVGLRWDEVDLDQEFILIGKDRTKNGVEHALPLTPYLLNMLKRRHEKRHKSPFVFPSPTLTGHYMDPKSVFNTISSRLGRSRELGNNITPHVLRHTFATTSQNLLINPRVQSKLLNHVTKSDITNRYIHSDVKLLREPLQQINDHLLKLMGADLQY
jgi:integrase